MDQVIWKAVVGYEDIYEVSNTGCVRSLDREIECSDGHIRLISGVELKPGLHKKPGCMTVNLCCTDGHPKTYNIARLVWDAFIAVEAIAVHHINGCGNNHVNNLKGKMPDGSWL